SAATCPPLPPRWATLVGRAAGMPTGSSGGKYGSDRAICRARDPTADAGTPGRPTWDAGRPARDAAIPRGTGEASATLLPLERGGAGSREEAGDALLRGRGDACPRSRPAGLWHPVPPGTARGRAPRTRRRLPARRHALALARRARARAERR